MDRLRLEAEFCGPRRVDELRRQAEARRRVAAAGPLADPIATIVARLAARIAPARAGQQRQRANGAIRGHGSCAAARHAGGG